ncbi:LytR family transcriptional attenuator [Luteimicrobium subarcticum]|uniref:LytR family transcriptional attenuator n=1 Tax=Luteimicrobium subarcticum TaxID=620910 RepID=A0A2M8WTG1_9MICO|nr:LytR family transcriptional attenuator [Luteimicrobium subarcticum]
MLRGVAIAAVAVLATAGGVSYGLARHFQNNVDTQDVDWLKHPQHTAAAKAKAATPEDQAAGNALNILVLGSDWRGGSNDTVVKDQGAQGNAQRSDTAMVLHVSADRKRVEVVSIPRDSIVDIPACQLDSKNTASTNASSGDMFNNAFAYGWDVAKQHGWNDSKAFGAAAACTWQTVESLTGIELDDYVVLDFAGFTGMIDALGGVDVCVPEHVDSKKAGHLVLDAGWQNLDGKTAIKWARARYDIADGSDIARIGRQQALVGSVVNKFFAQNYLTSAPRMLSFVDAVTKSLHTSSDIGSIGYMTGLGFSLRHLDMSNVTFRTVPFYYYPVDSAHRGKVGWQTDRAAALWAKVAADKPIGDTASTASSKPTASRTASSGTTTTTAPTKKPAAATPKRVVTGMDSDPLAAGDLPTTAAQCDAAITAASQG